MLLNYVLQHIKRLAAHIVLGNQTIKLKIAKHF